MPPLSREANKRSGSNPVKFFNVDLSSEGARVGIISSTSDTSSVVSAELGGGGDYDGSAPPPAAVAPTTPALLNSSTSKESVMQRLFRRTSTRFVHKAMSSGHLL